MNTTVDYVSKDLEKWINKLNAKFGSVKTCDCGGFNTDVSCISNPITDAENMDCCFTFKKIITPNYRNHDTCKHKLMKAVEDYIKDTLTVSWKEASLVWRQLPTTKYWHNAEYDSGYYKGYARLRIIDVNSKQSSYWEEI